MAKTMFYNSPYGGYKVTLSLEHYNNGRIAIQAYDEDMCPAFTATVNVPEQRLEANQAIIKDYSENEGVYKFLDKNGLIKSLHGFAGYGMPIVTLNMEELTKAVH